MLPAFGINVIGVYRIINTINGKSYIGSSVNIYYRLKKHFSELRRNVHANLHLQRSFNKHGEDAFDVIILARCLEKDLRVYEQDFIDKIKPQYNITTEVIRNTLSIESRKKISCTLKKQKELGILKFPHHLDKMKPVSIYTLDCIKIGDYKSQCDAAKKLCELYPEMKSPRSIVSSVINKKKRQYMSYKNHQILPQNCECKCFTKTHPNSKTLIVVDITCNEKYSFLNAKQASLFIGCHISSIEHALKQNRLVYKKFKIIR